MVRLPDAGLSGILSLRAALTRLLQEYPGKRNGLSRLEGELLREIHGGWKNGGGKMKAGVATGLVAVRESVGARLLLHMLRNSVRASVPLLRFVEPFAGNIEKHEFVQSILELTEVGRRALAGRA